MNMKPSQHCSRKKLQSVVENGSHYLAILQKQQYNTSLYHSSSHSTTRKRLILFNLINSHYCAQTVEITYGTKNWNFIICAPSHHASISFLFFSFNAVKSLKRLFTWRLDIERKRGKEGEREKKIQFKQCIRQIVIGHGKVDLK